MRKLIYILLTLAIVLTLLLLPVRETVTEDKTNQDVILLACVTPIPTNTPEPTPTPVPTPTPSPTPSPTPTPFMLNVNALYEGVVDETSMGEVASLQNRLTELGYYKGSIDGKYGSGTAEAVRFFQTVNHLEVTGNADYRTITTLYSDEAVMDPAPTPTPIINGVSGDDIQALQDQLVLYGFLGKGADGIYGDKTKDAIRRAELYIHNKQEQYYLAHPTPSPSPTPLLITPTPTPEITPQMTKDPIWRSMYPNYSVIPSPTPTLRIAPTATPYNPEGNVTQNFLQALYSPAFDVYAETVQNGVEGDEARRVQNRLLTLGYLRSADGVFGPKTELALKYFQVKNGLPETGIADEATQRKLYSESAVVSDTVVTKYKITISTSKQRVYVYEWNGTGFNPDPVKTFKCSTGKNDTPTPKGTFWNTGRISEWYYFKEFDCWARYAWTIEGGVLFHSVIYDSKNVKTLRNSTVKNLGKKASHGCVRLAVKDAQWIYENCGAGTPVTVV